jgi:uncharacterized protein YecT (DUF1311 family)
MSQERAPRPAGLVRQADRPGPAWMSRSWLARASRPGLARAAVSVALLGALAACGGSGAPASTSSAPSAPPTAGPSGAAAPGATAAASAGAAAFAPIVEPFDPGHAARSRPAPTTCGGQATSRAVRQCYEARTENADATMDTVQLARYRGGSAAQRAAILADDSAWLAARQPVCAEAFGGGGAAGQVAIASCLLDESTARLDALQGITPPEAVLKATDNTDPRAFSWYTTPKGSRIAMVDTQGDGTGGAIIAWVIIGGADGFVVNPAQFYFSDGSFTDHGVAEPPDPSFHRVLPGTEYQFAIDYSHLSSDPGAAQGTGGYVYVPGAPVAIWR